MSLSIDWTIKEWYIIVSYSQEGPYSLHDLKIDGRFTPDTLVWKKGFKEWIPARFVAEMEPLFKDTPESRPLHPNEKETVKSDFGQEQAALALQQDPYQLFLLIVLLLLILLYTYYAHRGV